MKSFIYLPIEVSRRELPAKVMLGYKLAALGYTTVIFEHTYLDRIGWKYPGIYLGKNFFRTETPVSKLYYNAMKDKNINIWHLDEEGGMFAEHAEDIGFKDFLTSRLDVSQLNGSDRVYCWGEAQKKFYETKNINNIDIKVSGTPNFEVLKPIYANSFLESDLKLTNNKRDFILVNTRSVFVNPRKTLEYAVGSEAGSNTEFFNNHWEDTLLEDSIMIGEFVKLVNKISLNYKNETIIIRPHPEESNKIYEFYFKNNKNVIVCNDGQVDSWIRLSKLMIHYGCTTALQADIAEKKVFTFLPDSLSSAEVSIKYFLNKIGSKITNFYDFKIFFDKHLEHKNSKEIWKDRVSNKNSIEFLASEINAFARSDKSFFFKKQPLDLKINIKENIKILIRKILKKNIHEMENFNNIENIFKSAENHYKIKIDPIKVNQYCYIIPGAN